MGEMHKTLILGLGNEVLTDDAIGPRIVKDLQSRYTSEDICFSVSSLGGIEILEHICGYDRVVIIDAIRTRNGIPGDVYLMKPEDFRETMHLSSFHDVNFLTALKLGKVLDLCIPECIEIIAVEIIEDLVFSEVMTPELELRYPGILHEIIDYLEFEIVV